MLKHRKPQSSFRILQTQDVANTSSLFRGKKNQNFNRFNYRGKNESTSMFKKKALSQTFLKNGRLIKKLVRNSLIGKNDLVIEVGPGDGVILNELIEQAREVIGIEIDFDFYHKLVRKYSNKTNLNLYLGDALSFPVPRAPYKVFSNIPFAIEGELIRKFLNEKNPPDDCFLIIRKDLAERLCRKNTLFNISNAPFFEFSIFHYFRRRDFLPVPKVEAAMFRFKKRPNPLIPFEEKNKYQNFVKIAFGNGLPIYTNLKKRYGIIHSNILKNIGISKDTRPGSLSIGQWLALYKYLR